MPSPTEFGLTDAQAQRLIQEGDAIVERLKALAVKMGVQAQPSIMTALQHAVARGLIEITGPDAHPMQYVDGCALFAGNLLQLTIFLAKGDKTEAQNDD